VFGELIELCRAVRSFRCMELICAEQLLCAEPLFVAGNRSSTFVLSSVVKLSSLPSIPRSSLSTNETNANDCQFKKQIPKIYRTLSNKA
jgi:hypothetical protein